MEIETSHGNKEHAERLPWWRDPKRGEPTRLKNKAIESQAENEEKLEEGREEGNKESNQENEKSE